MCCIIFLVFYSHQMYVQDIAFPSSRNRINKRIQEYSNKNSLKSMHSDNGKSWSELDTRQGDVSGKTFFK